MELKKFFLIVLALIVLAFGAALLILWRDRIDLTRTNNAEVRDFYVRLSQGQVGFNEAGGMIFPDDRRFFDRKKNYIESGTDFLEVDLKTMRISLYRAGRFLESFPVLTKGREGSWWETPTGDYRVLNKEANHFSSIGKVWMPWSIQFYGNFFIHGWPYYESGNPVTKTFSGGCIRLSTEDGKKIYEFVSLNTPILVRDSEPEIFYAALPSGGKSGPPPSVGAKAFLVADVATGETILEKRADEQLSVASLTKLMTAVVASELIYLDRSITVTPNLLAAVLASFSPEVGKRYSAFDLLYPLLMQSSNKTANVLAGFIGREKFVSDMNEKAASLSMSDTSFADPSGISAENISSAEDILKLLRYIYFKRRFIFDITKGKEYDYLGSSDFSNLSNFNEFASDPRLLGMKNGETRAALQTLASVWEFEKDGSKIPLAIIVLGSDDRKADTRELLRWLEKNYALR